MVELDSPSSSELLNDDNRSGMIVPHDGTSNIVSLRKGTTFSPHQKRRLVARSCGEGSSNDRDSNSDSDGGSDEDCKEKISSFEAARYVRLALLRFRRQHGRLVGPLVEQIDTALAFSDGLMLELDTQDQHRGTGVGSGSSSLESQDDINGKSAKVQIPSSLSPTSQPGCPASVVSIQIPASTYRCARPSCLFYSQSLCELGSHVRRVHLGLNHIRPGNLSALLCTGRLLPQPAPPSPPQPKKLQQKSLFPPHPPTRSTFSLKQQARIGQPPLTAPLPLLPPVARALRAGRSEAGASCVLGGSMGDQADGLLSGVAAVVSAPISTRAINGFAAGGTPTAGASPGRATTRPPPAHRPTCCSECGGEPLKARGLCNRCYENHRIAKLKARRSAAAATIDGRSGGGGDAAVRGGGEGAVNGCVGGNSSVGSSRVTGASCVAGLAGASEGVTCGQADWRKKSGAPSAVARHGATAPPPPLPPPPPPALTNKRAQPSPRSPARPRAVAPAYSGEGYAVFFGMDYGHPAVVRARASAGFAGVTDWLDDCVRTAAAGGDGGCVVHPARRGGRSDRSHPKRRPANSDGGDDKDDKSDGGSDDVQGVAGGRCADELLCCDVCTNAVHPACLRPPLAAVPPPSPPSVFACSGACAGRVRAEMRQLGAPAPAPALVAACEGVIVPRKRKRIVPPQSASAVGANGVVWGSAAFVRPPNVD